MKNTLISLSFRIGVDILGFPIILNHYIHRYMYNSYIGRFHKVDVSQELIKQY